MSELFISYKQEERERMRPIANALRALKVDVWFDEKLSPDKAFTEEIETVVNTCRAQLVCWSPAAVRSEWVRGEAEIGRQRQTLVQVMTEPCVLPPPFNMIHAENLSEWSGAPEHTGWQKVLDAIGRRVGRLGLAELAILQGSPDGEAWKKWAAQYPTDPCAEEAWAKAETFHLAGEKERLAKEWKTAHKRAEEAEAKRRVAEEARRTAAPQPAQRYEPPLAKRGVPVGLIVGGVVAVALAGVGIFLAPGMIQSTALIQEPSAAPVAETAAASTSSPNLAAFTKDLSGRWKLATESDCGSPWTLRIEGGALTFAKPGDPSQAETIIGVEQGWLRTEDVSKVPSYYQRSGNTLALRYGDIETPFLICE